jgi:RimJ/RimL family protein N-acetyltransferase
MLTDHYPAYGLRLRTPRLELRLPDLDDLAILGEVAQAGVHAPADMPFGEPWTDQPREVLGRSVINYNLGLLARSTREAWVLPFAVVFEGAPIGAQVITAEKFSVLREVHTGSWIGLRHQRQGIGTEMRAAVLHLAFEGLGARYATSAAHIDNPASNGVSRRLGYEPDGIARSVVRGEVAVDQRLRLTRERWLELRTVPVTIEGLGPCLRDLDVEPAPQAEALAVA